ncbi:MAG TPA: LPS export ABC transporter periplasmic protein LptC, partial [Acidovorax sp.]|nr:LPS export ABC transporter periplasmic protein LptC [Acidovorax sp.]
MGLLALGTWWLVRNAPMPLLPATERPPLHQPDYFMKSFSVKSFDAAGRLQSEVQGDEARHYPDTDTLEIDKARMRSVAPTGRLTVATADRALTNADGSEVQLFGNAIVTREPLPAKP